MKSNSTVVAAPWQESFGTCACCGQTSKTIWGGLTAEEVGLATYFVHWTRGSSMHDVNVDLVIGAWGDGTSPQDRVLVSLLYRPSSNGGSFMVIDAKGRLAAKRELCGRAMLRGEVVGTPFGQEIFSLLDAVWLDDPRIAEVKALNDSV